MSFVSQETFDSIVAENVNDFDMSYDEAVREAESQLKMQGADLSQIDRTPPELRKQKEMSHVMNAIVENLNKSLQEANAELLLETLSSLQKEINQDEQGKGIFDKSNGIATLFDLLAHDSYTAHQHEILTSLVVCLRNPSFRDHISLSQFQQILSLLREHSRLSAICVSGCNVLRNACIKNESNRVTLVEHGVVEALEQVLNDHRSKDVLQSAFGLIRGLVLTDDEDRAGFNFKGPEHALKIAGTSLIDAILSALDIQPFDEELTVDACNTLSKVAIRNDICELIRLKGGIIVVLRLLTRESSRPDIVRYCSIALKALAGNDDCKREICENEGLFILLQIIQQHSATAVVLENSISCLGAIVLRNPDYAHKLGELGAADVLVNLMQQHMNSSPGVLKFSCVTIRNAVARNPENRPVFLTAGTEDVLREVGRRHPSLYGDYAKAALRDLGCHVELREEWKGEIGKGSKLAN
eukprot:TRINITY_DN3067_c0_g1_i1.p1 TRINITY_DN3067_c0_g1~~TRINITY_DN3067_c0_g1_i1.p1  ORF type:complete len:470 (-),score=99.48 TRINITY_DN3067_c0_g1_i1:35-1444(-)